jgi:acyl-CoA reductase-like NAD-dependent aldehyde dehydrogenase
MSPSARGRILWKIGDLILENLEELAQLESRPQGRSFETQFKPVCHSVALGNHRHSACLKTRP